MNAKKSFRINTTKEKKFGTNEELAEISDLPAAQIAEFREIFRLIDTDGSNTLSLNELKQLLENLHFDTHLLGDDFFLDLVGKVRQVKRRASVAPTPGMAKRGIAPVQQFQEVTVRYFSLMPHFTIRLGDTFLTDIQSLQFDELMSAILMRPPIEKYTKTELAKHFAYLGNSYVYLCTLGLLSYLTTTMHTPAGSNAKPGKIDFDVLRSAIRNGDGGMDPSVAEEMMTMMANIPGGEVDYLEMIELLLGSSKV